MGIFNIMANLCSVIGLFVSLFVASKVLKINNSNNNNAGKLNQGDGTQKIVENHSILADNHSSATYNDYTGAMIVGELDEPPVLSESSYLILTDEVDKYQFGVARNTSDLAMKAANTFCITADFKNMISKPDESRWIGYSIKSLPMNDWRSFINENYSLNFNYAAIGVHIPLERNSQSAIAERLSAPNGKLLLIKPDYAYSFRSIQGGTPCE